MQMSDGTILATAIDLPYSNSTKFDLVMDRTPYGFYALAEISLIYLLQGFATLKQDVRGTGGSGGTFQMWNDSPADSYATLEWASKQPWFNGNTWALGASADGLNALSEARNPHPSLRGQFVIFAGGVAYPMVFPGGALRYQLAHTWLMDTVRPSDFPSVWQEVLENEAPGSWWDRMNSTGWDLSVVDYKTVQW